MKLYPIIALAFTLMLTPSCSEAKKTYSPTIHTLDNPSNTRIKGESNSNNSNNSNYMAMISSLIDKTVYFDYNKAILLDAYKPLLQEKAMILKDNPNIRLRIEGNTDVRGAEWYNDKLGADRATVVYNYLVALGVNPAQLQTISHGKNRPLTLGGTEQAHAQNRRVTFSIITQ